MNLTSSAGLCSALAHYGVIRASGPDARGFLQAQLTTDLGELTAQTSQLAAWCNAKGRVQAIFRLFMRGENIYLRLPAELVPLTLPRLKMFVLRSKVVLETLTDWGAIGIDGFAPDTAPARINAVTQAGELTFIRVPPAAAHRFEIWGPRAAIASVGDQLSRSGLSAANVDAWRRGDLQAGLPELHPQTREAFTPHMLNLDLLGAVAFGKGCYPGQEVVAKTQHRGLAKRRLFIATCATSAPPAPGTRVLTADGQHAGDVVEALANPDGGCALSAVLMLDHAKDSGLHFADSQAPLTLQPLPYELP